MLIYLRFIYLVNFVIYILHFAEKKLIQIDCNIN